ncbi:glycosyltransferase involved in cell wall biosynthesis [Rhizomicrobium palustre]|uniref:Glycosyltransferase involved in cell wall biosynthesis n=1 Tax=Rhizomicrobium palustre TaxID=189966 RepID=A0A846MTF1_9PROT|nr:glycosyltransferase involved in cell wall biosynthesis [Rhizomicrobium palustre]
MRELVGSGKLHATVIAPVPFFPLPIRHPQLGRIDRVPYREEYSGMAVYHPRYLVLPKIGMRLTPFTLYHAMHTTLRQLLSEGHRFDLIDAHYFYPDGVAAVRLAKEFGLPVVVTARGTDINLIPRFSGPRRAILDAAAKADGVITVCQALKDEMVALGAQGSKIRVLRNGVDLKLFHPKDRDKDRTALGLHRRTLVSVGWLIERKGHHHVIAAMPELPDTDLLIVGDGPERAALERLAARLGVGGRVRFLGMRAQKDLPAIYRAADALVLASSREGWANVLLEAMACGTPVVASNVWGTPEVVASPVAGVLMKQLDAAGVAEAVVRLFKSLPTRGDTRLYAEQFGWAPTTQGQIALFREILERRTRHHSVPTLASNPHL